MSTRVRGQETFCQLVVDGAIQSGSFTKIENFKVTPRADLTDSSFLGETEDEPDVQHHGYDFSWVCHEMDNKAFEVWDNVVDALNAGTLLPRIDVVVIKRYRDPAIPAVTLTLQNCKIKMDSQDYGARKDYVKTSFSGKCRRKRTR